MATLSRWDPFRDLMSIQGELNRLFGRTYAGDGGTNVGAWAPAMDIYEMFIRSSQRPQVARIFLPYLPLLPAGARGARFDRASLPYAGAVSRFARPRAGMPEVKAAPFRSAQSARAEFAPARCVIGQTQAAARAPRGEPGRAADSADRIRGKRRQEIHGAGAAGRGRAPIGREVGRCLV